MDNRIIKNILVKGKNLISRYFHISSYNFYKRDDIIEIFAIIFTIKAATLFLSYISFEIFQNITPTILQLWNRWDTHNYINIAQNGYTNVGESSLFIVFFPLYPLLIRLFAVFIGDYLFSAMVVSNLASVLAVLLFYKLVSKDYTSNNAIRAVFYFLVFPTAYFLSAAYTESLFVFLSIASFYYAREGRWFLAGVFGGLASTTRITGVVLFPALIIEYWVQKRGQMRFKEIGWLLLIPLCFSVYLIINYVTFGDAFAFLTIQKQHWFKELSPPWIGFLNSLGGIGWRSPSERMLVDYAEIIFSLLGLTTVIVGFLYLRISYNVYALLTWLLITSNSYWLSIPRYTLTIFPLFILLSLAGQRKEINYLITVISLIFFSLFLILFAQGRWAF